ncbi:GntR family transcriptional regulator, partial [Vibrio sp. 10N.222.51.C12]
MPAINTKKISRFRAVEEYIEKLVQNGALSSGDKLPSIRATSIKLGVAKNTVIRAYQELEATGRVAAQDRSGFIVQPAFIRHCTPLV